MKVIKIEGLVPRYIKTVAIFFAVWIAAALMFEGFLPIVLGIIFFLSLIFTIPYLIVKDIHKVGEMLVEDYKESIEEPRKSTDNTFNKDNVVDVEYKEIEK